MKRADSETLSPGTRRALEVRRLLRAVEGGPDDCWVGATNEEIARYVFRAYGRYPIVLVELVQRTRQGFLQASLVIAAGNRQTGAWRSVRLSRPGELEGVADAAHDVLAVIERLRLEREERERNGGE